MEAHDVRPASVTEGWFGLCYDCGDRGPLGDHQQALDWSDEHRIRSEQGYIPPDGSRNPQIRTVIREFRSRSTDPRWSEDERALWGKMASELESRIGPDEGQDSLF